MTIWVLRGFSKTLVHFGDGKGAETPWGKMVYKSSSDVSSGILARGHWKPRQSWIIFATISDFSIGLASTSW